MSSLPAPIELSEHTRATALAVLPPGLYSRLEPYAERLDLGLITRAYEFSKFAHAGQKRHSGEDYVIALRGGGRDPGRAAPGLGDASPAA